MIKMYWAITLLALLLLSGCNEKGNFNSKEVRKELFSQKIIHATDAQIVGKAKEEGKILSDSIVYNFYQNKSTISGSCQPQFAKSASLYKQWGNFNFSVINPSTFKSNNTKVQEVVSMYKSVFEQNLVSEENVQKLGDTALIYSRPISLMENTCSNCHKALQIKNALILVNMNKPDVIMKIGMKK